MIENAEKIDYDIKSTPLSKEESGRLSKIIADYKKGKTLKKRINKHISNKGVSI